MPLYKIERAERGVLYKTYTVMAADADEANELIWEDDIEPDSEYFDQHDVDQHTTTEIGTDDAIDALDDQTLEDLGL